MRTSWLGSIALISVLGGSLANAADMPVKAPVYRAPPVAVANWTGCYIGGNAGFGWQRNRAYDVVFGADAGSDTGDGLVAGGQIGCDYQSGPWVFGLQGMANWTDIEGNHRYVGGDSSDNETLRFHTRWFATFTGRIGYAVAPNMLLYVKGGGAWVRIRYKDEDPDAAISYVGRASATRSGWTIGGGGEYQINPNWSIFAEYNYVDLGARRSRVSYDCSDVCDFDNPYTYRFKHNLQTVLFGINYRFGGPIVARY